jgi:hypothetical protein
VPLDFGSDDLERLVVAVPGGKLAAEGEIFLLLRGSEPKNFSKIGDHASGYYRATVKAIGGRRNGNRCYTRRAIEYPARPGRFGHSATQVSTAARPDERRSFWKPGFWCRRGIHRGAFQELRSGPSNRSTALGQAALRGGGARHARELRPR